MLIQEVHVARNVPPGVRMAVGIRFLHAGVQKHSLVLDDVEQAPRIGLVAANEQGQFLPDEVVYFPEGELHLVFARTPITFTRDSQGNMLLLFPGTSEDDQSAIRVIDGAAQIAIG